jgi:MoaA/NifB/PqqE/SkfB family radical SAM enzyme
VSELGWKYLTADDKAAIVRGVRDGVAYGGPYHVEIHPADRCNIDCFFCSTAALRGTDELSLTRLEEMIGELKELGTRSIRLSGGGEPFFHRKTNDFLRTIAKSGIPIENITTNAVLLRDEVASILLGDGVCDQLTVSLNTADPKTYASMMQTTERNFERVVENVKKLIIERKRLGRTTPKVNLQFLVWKENFRSIPQMYALARDAGVDTILFNGLAFLKPEQKMTVEETAEMMRLYEEVIRIDEFRRIASIESYEQDIRPMLAGVTAKLDAERRARGTVGRLAHFLTRRDVTWNEKIAHRRRIAALKEMEREIAGLDEPCIIGWHSMLIRVSGVVAPCCILQGSPLGNVYKQSIREVWYGEEFARFRRELARIMREREAWSVAGDDKTVVEMCAGKGSETCPIKSFYFKPDVAFMKSLNAALR